MLAWLKEWRVVVVVQRLKRRARPRPLKVAKAKLLRAAPKHLVRHVVYNAQIKVVEETAMP